MEDRYLRESDEIDIRELFAVIRRRLWVIVLLPFAAAAVAAIFSLFVMTPIYEASTTLWVVKTDGAALDMNTLQFNRQLIRTYGEVAKSRVVASQVMQRLGINGDVERFQKRVTVTPVRDTEIIAIRVEDPNPARAATIADTLAEVFSEEIQKFIRLDNVRVVDPALVPTDPVRPRVLLNTSLALVLGLLLSVGLAFLLEQLDVRIRAPADVERRLGLPVVGVIPLLTPASDQEIAAQGRQPAVPPLKAGGELG